MRNTILICLFLFSSVQLSGQSFTRLNEADFKNPPAGDRPYAWWHFIDNHITKEGITKDLEAMQQQGIYGVTLLNVNRFDGRLGNATVKFNSTGWYDMFKYILQEAKRLKIDVGVQNCDGWSTSGGPWITPETSMKQYTWRKSFLTGGKRVTVKLGKPSGNSNFYKDAFVVAYPSAKPNSFELAGPSILTEGKNNGQNLADGYPASSISLKAGETVVIKFGAPFTAEVLLLHTQRTYSRKGTLQTTLCSVEASDDGIHYRDVADVADSIVNETYMSSFPKTTARFFRIKIKDILNNGNDKTMRVGELALLKKDERGLYQSLISAHQAKTVAVTANSMNDFYNQAPISYPGALPDDGVIKNKKQVVDITRFMGEDGTLNWNAPAGDWTIIRFGYTTTGKKIHPATKEGEGLECDKMDTAALNLHFKSFPRKLADAAASVTGNTFSYLLVDSWEALYQNWTGNFAAEFEKRRGYSLIPYIPVLCGEVVENITYSEAFLHDFRETIADLIGANFFKHMADLCHRQGLRLHGESIYGGLKYPPLDILRSYSYLDVPMTEFWAPVQAADTLFTYNPKTRITSTLAAHAAFLYNKPILASESYTGFAMYSDSPWDIKLYGDNAATEGVNRFVLHSYVHQPTEKKPGITLGMYGLTFNRHNTWWPYSGSFFDEQARVQQLLQKGKTVSDVLVYMGDRYPFQESDGKTAMLLPGVRYNYCNADVLYHRISVKNNKLLLDNQFEFQFLLVSDTLLNLSTLQKIEELVRQGAVVAAPRPAKTLSLKNYEADQAIFQEISKKLWLNIDGKAVTEHKYGKGRIIWGDKPDKLLKENAFVADLELKGAKSEDLMYIHKKLDEDDVYYLVNKSNDKALQLETAFRLSGKTPSLWDPVDGRIYRQALFYDDGKVIKVPLYLRPKQSLFVVFKDGGSSSHFVKLQDANGLQLFPADGSAQVERLPVLYFETDNEVAVSSFDGGHYKLTSDKGALSSFQLEKPAQMVLSGATGFIKLDDAPDVDPFDINSFSSLTQSENPAVKYYSGIVTYEFRFNIPADFLKKGRQTYLQLDQFGSTAAISLNGKTLQTIWEPGYKLNISPAVKSGPNHILIKVTNPWRNRLIGDMKNSRGERNAWTTSPFTDKTNNEIINKNTGLLNSGISKPVKIYNISTTRIEL